VRPARGGCGRSFPRPVSITCARFLADGCTLATAGAADGVVKLWDLRCLVAPRASITPPQQAVKVGGRGTLRLPARLPDLQQPTPLR
jgi:hypothetical protein